MSTYAEYAKLARKSLDEHNDAIRAQVHALLAIAAAVDAAGRGSKSPHPRPAAKKATPARKASK